MSMQLQVIKSNYLVEASYRLSLLEQRVVLYAIAQSRDVESTDLGYRFGISSKCEIRVQDFADMYGLSRNDLYETLRSTVNDLFQREVSMDYVDQVSGQRVTLKTRWITSQMYSDGLGYLAFSFAPEVLPYLSNLKGSFTKYDLEAIAHLSSGYAVRLYELFKQYQVIGSREILLSDLRQILQIDDRYPLFSDLKKRVLDPAVKQINASTDLSVSFSTSRRDRKISLLRFKIGKARAKPVQPRLFTSKVLTEVKPLHSSAQATLEASLAAIQAKADAAKAVS